MLKRASREALLHKLNEMLKAQKQLQEPDPELIASIEQTIAEVTQQTRWKRPPPDVSG